MLRVVSWADDAWLRIASMRLWDWLWSSTTVTITATTSETAGTIPAKRYVHDATRIGTAWMTFMPWQRFRLTYPTISAGTPTVWSIRPDNAFVVDAAPTADTTITVERYSLPTAMTADADIPAMPTHLHMAIVWYALSEAADYEEAGISRRAARAKYGEILGDLLSEATPVMEAGAPLL